MPLVAIGKFHAISKKSRAWREEREPLAVPYDQDQKPDREHDEDERRPVAGTGRRGGRNVLGVVKPAPRSVTHAARCLRDFNRASLSAIPSAGSGKSGASSI